ncbi:probable multidrug resistance-associated protein lethal(2)03659 [Onthophagus taurus]|uniref:probable multidrug resistance-associated protein lethal(2)03659 n=1 Tax=Onthophagus taurus TaxID=166361 RepID=UPI0039BDEBFC
MDPGFVITRENPKAEANIFSKLTFAWMGNIFYKGVKRGVNVTDLFKTLNSDNSEILGDRLQANWEKEIARSKLKGKEPSLVKAISDTFLLSYMVYGLMLFILYVGLKVFQPLVLGYLLRLFTKRENPENMELAKYITGLILVCVVFLAVLLQHHTNFGQQSVGMRVRIAVSTLVYRKMLKLSKKSLGDTAAGKVVNLLANDVQRFDFVAIALHFFWISPFQVAIVTYFIQDQVGIACLAGIISMLIFTIPLQVVMGKLTTKWRGKVAVRTDSRVKLMNEIISGIQVIKMYAWEKPFEKLVHACRINEVKAIRVANYIRAVFLSSMVFVERTTLYLTLITYVLLDNQLSSDITFTLSQYFNLLQMALAIFLPLAIQMTAESLVSLRRLREFLMMDERKVGNLIKTEDKGIEVNKVSANWTEEHNTLKDLNINIKPGSLCAIIGPVGSGKSSILQLLLGELQAETGEIKVGGTISYSSQEPWLFGSNVRGNILFGQELDKQHYNRVVKVCALEKDFQQFPQRDQTLVGERGVSLSGGQRARINLARAIYRNADIYMMDDPLSAVDTHVGKHLFEECIVKYLHGKTRILVTHQLQYLKKADMIIVMNDGRIEAQGTFDELSRADLDFTKMLVAADETVEKKEPEKELKRVRSRQESTSSMGSTGTGADFDDQEVKRQDEEIVIPSRSASIDYIKAAGSVCIILTLAMVIVSSQTACSGADYFVSYWTEQEELRFIYNQDPPPEGGEETKSHHSKTEMVYGFLSRVERSTIHGFNYMFGTTSDFNYTVQQRDLRDDDGFINTYNAIYIYSALIILIILLTMMRSYLFFRCASNSSKRLHAKMFNCLLKAPMRFFDTNPSGRILNRFSKDTGAMDETLPRVLSEALQIMLVMTGSLVLISIANIWMLIVIAVLVVVFIVLRRWFLVTAKSIKHVEGIAKSPVFSLLNSTLSGISTIRASNAEMSLIKEFDRHQDAHTSAWFMTISVMVSFGLWLDLLCVVFLTCILVSFIVVSETTDVSGAMVGLAVSQSLGLTGMLQHGMRQTAEVVNQLTSVERILQYTKLDMEGPFESPEAKKPAKDWPTDGGVKFNKMYLKYAPEDPPVLKDLNIEINSGEKVGIVGRTGAGKSSLMSALFRLAPIEGEILVDKIDTATVGLHDIRSKVSIIPQEPVLFSAPMRYNLDPFNEYSDIDLWNALEEVELKESVPSLEFKVEEGGANFSVGQRQLICLARAIIRNNKILVMDEATANVDPQTDGLIQGTIRKKFKKCTVLTIAHRLNTIMDSDKVLVMDSGKMVEFDHPHKLLQNSDGYFSKMVDETGPSMSANLREIAKFTFDKLSHENESTKL